MSKKEASVAKPIGDKFGKYVAKEEVKKIYAAMKVTAKVLDTTNNTITFLSKPEVKNALMKVSPDLAKTVGKATGIAKALGPAGIVLGTGVDIFVALGLVQDATMAKLDEISNKIDVLRSEVEQGFQNLKAFIKSTTELNRFLPIYDAMLTNVLKYEKLISSPAKSTPDIFMQKMEEMVGAYSPSQIVRDLETMHNLIAGKTGIGGPLFEVLSHEVNAYKGKNADQFIANFILKFQTVIGVEMRAVRMLRSFVAFTEKDVIFAKDIESIFRNIADQRKEYDPAIKFAWYLKFMATGGVVKMKSRKWPKYSLTMTHFDTKKMEGYTGKIDENGVFIITPHAEGGKFLISTKEQPKHYLYMENALLISEIVPWTPNEDPGPQGHWNLIIKDFQERSFTLTTYKWPNWFMYLSDSFLVWSPTTGSYSVFGKDGDCDMQGEFTLDFI
jgi:hypothetical protein